MNKNKRTRSLRMQTMQLVLLCWLIPVLMVLLAMLWNLSDSVGQRTERFLSEQFQTSLQMCTDRVNSAAEASRLASYDHSIKDAWSAYKQDGIYVNLYQETYAFLSRQYGTDSRFLYSIFWFSEDPEHMTVTTFTGMTGSVYTQVSQFWPGDFEAANALASGLDTGIGFLEMDGRVYLVRNLMDSHYDPIGVLVLALNLPYYFDELSAISWTSAVEVQLGDSPVIPLKGENLDGFSDVRRSECLGEGYTLSARAAIDYESLLAPYRSYKYLLFGLAALLLPLLLLTFRFLKRRISQPVDVLMDGARKIEQGRLGYQLDYQANSREFQYLTDSFNHMSGQLRSQFDRLYKEEIALRDAHIKALQAHINPHFLNNTLEIINWEARMNSDAKVSKMIEALSTVLDAALDRKKAPEVRLAEEMTYVNAYLYIINQRFGKRLSITIDLPDALMECKVPRLIIQPVIENAVEHGIGPGGHGSVALRGYVEDEFLFLEIENDGGLSPQDEEHIKRLLSPDYDSSCEPSGNIGISNVNLRLRILYGESCGLRIFRMEDNRVLARLKIALSRNRQ